MNLTTGEVMLLYRKGLLVPWNSKKIIGTIVGIFSITFLIIVFLRRTL